METVKSILERKGNSLYAVPADADVETAAHLMNEKNIGALVVMEDGKAIGIVSERDLLGMVAAGRKAGQTKVAEIMSAPVITCRRDTTLRECQSIMTQRRIRRLPVIEGDCICGIVTLGDLLASQIEEDQLSIQYINNYILFEGNGLAAMTCK